MKKLVCKENGRSFELTVPKEWEAKTINVDGQLINDQTIRKCDYALVVDHQDQKRALFYIEFKGVDLKEAIPQLESTISILKRHPAFKDYYNAPIKEAHAVCKKIQKYPQTDSQFQNAVSRFRKKHGFTLKCHTQKGIVKLS